MLLILPVLADTIVVAQSAPAPTPVIPDESVVDHVPPGSVLLRPWILLDPHLSRREVYLWGGPVHERPTDHSATTDGYAGGIAWSIETRRRNMLVRASVEHGLRVTGPDHFTVSLAQYMYGAGFSLGPVEATARAGFAFLQFHFGHEGFGFGAFAPRVDGGAALTLGAIRLGFHAFSEYSWRWTDGPSAFVRGVLFELALGGPAPLDPMYRVENAPQ